MRAGDPALHGGESIRQVAVHRCPEHHPGVRHGQRDFFQQGVNGSGLKENNAIRSTDVLGGHCSQHGNTCAAKDNIAILDLARSGKGHKFF